MGLCKRKSEKKKKELKKMDTKEVQSKKEKRKRNENKDNPCSRKRYSTREEYILESTVELG